MADFARVLAHELGLIKRRRHELVRQAAREQEASATRGLERPETGTLRTEGRGDRRPRSIRCASIGPPGVGRDGGQAPGS